ncbi:MAG: hypothetical protein QOE51_3831 [Actinoplanes sp.]|jgi:hypothetical protein|nr:hypothetical protein [Actinoplanes sp.]
MSVPELPGVLSAGDLAATVDFIATIQDRSGGIPWFAGGHLDPWDHIEAAMALDAGARHGPARAAYRWLRARQRPDGSWVSRYEDDAEAADYAETHHAAYLATGLWQHWLMTGDREFLAELWPVVRRAMAFVVAQQAESGAVWWAVGAGGEPDRTALLTGCASIFQSLRCAIGIAELLERPQPDWDLALARLGHTLRRHPEAFAAKDRFSMDWYYPVLAGAVRGAAAAERLAERWADFVEAGRGVRCVADRGWVTGAETCELALALATAGRDAEAAAVVASMQHLRHDDGGYWTGLVLDDGLHWPVERTTWTAAAVVLAAVTITGDPRSQLFRGAGLPTEPEIDCGVDLVCG